MRATILFLGLAMQAALAGANAASQADSTGRRDAGSDLDFLINEEYRPPAVTPEPKPGKIWIYWAAAGAAAACGGIGWYWYEANAKPAPITRDYQLFTDAR